MIVSSHQTVQHQNRLLAAFSGESLHRLEADLRVASVPQGTTLLEPGSPVDQIYFPLTGMISLVIITKAGDMVETGTVGREGALGLQAGLGKRISFGLATMQIGGDVASVSAARLAAAVELDTGLRRLIASYTELLWIEAQQIAACNAIHDASSRLCRWLLQCADRTGSNELTLTHEFLAQMLGVRRTTVSLLAQGLQARHIIRYSRGRIRILDRDALQAAACECYEITQFDALPLRTGIDL